MKFLKRVKFPYNILLIYSVWRVALFIVFVLGEKIFLLQHRFLAGTYWEYIKHPLISAWGNFDGQRYISIAQNGYTQGSYSYFPIYPKLISLFTTSFLPDRHYSYLLVGLLISNIAFIVALVGLHKLINIDYKKNIAMLTIIILLLFPTSFFFGSVYTESLFLMFVVWSIYFARKSHWLPAAVLGALASSTRFPGIVLLPILLIEFYLQNKKKLNLNSITLLLLLSTILLVALGLGSYMYYLKVQTGDPLVFFNEITLYGEQRTTQLITLPQVLYRYVFKVLPSLNYYSFTSTFPVLLEFSSAILFLVISVLGFFRLRLSYAIYLVLGFLIPTFAGSFSSMSRYVLILFPGFILLAHILSKDKRVLVIWFILSAILLATSELLFLRGHWIA